MTDVIRNENEVIETVVAEPEKPIVPVVEETVEPEVEETVKPRVGIVVNCAKLNVRKKPTKAAEVHCIIDKGAEVEIDDNRPESKWVRVIVNGVVGFCMREYIQEV